MKITKITNLVFLALFLIAGFANVSMAQEPVEIQPQFQLAKLDQKFLLPERGFEVRDILDKLEQRLSVYPKDHEAEFLKAILFFKAGNIDKALVEINRLIKKVPDFQLAYLLKGDLLLARYGGTKKAGTNYIAFFFNASPG